MSHLEKTITDLLELRKENGLWQSEIESISGYSKSHLSETIKEMESRSTVIRRKEGNVLNRVWGTLYFPGSIDGIIRTGILKSSEYLPALNILNRICRDHGIRMKARLFLSSVEMLESLYAGSIEIAMAPSLTQIMYAAIRGGLIFVSAVATGGSGIYENRNSGSEYCAGSEISTMSFMTRKFLGEHEDVLYIPYESPDSGFESFRAGSVKYIASWEPYCRKIESLDYAKRIVSYSELLGEMPCCLMSCSESLRADYRKILYELHEEYSDFCASHEMKPELAEDSFGVFNESMKEFIPDSLKHYTFISEIEEDILGRIADENGILVSHSTVSNWADGTVRLLRP